MNSLDTLSMTGFELSGEQLEDVDGGAFFVGLAVGFAALYLIEKYG